MQINHDENPEAEPSRSAPRRSVSLREPGGRIAEMVFDSHEVSTSFAVWNGAECSMSADLTDAAGRHRPYSPDNSLVENKIVLFPQSALDYGSEADLVSSVRSYIHRYVDLDPTFESIASYYVLLSWVYDAFVSVQGVKPRAAAATA